MVCAAPPALFGSPDGNAAYGGDAALAAAAAAQATATAAAAAAAAAQSTANSALALAASATSAIADVPSLMRLVGQWGIGSAANSVSTTGAFHSSGMATVGSTLTTNIAPTNTSLITQRQRVIISSASNTNRWAGYRNGGVGMCFRGDTAGHGGFRLRCLFGTATALTNQSLMIGLKKTATTTDFADASAFTLSNSVDSVFLGYDAAGTQLVLMHNDSAGTCTQVTLNGGTGFAKTSTDLFRFTLVALPNAADMTYEVINVGTGLTATGTLSSNLPTNTTTMAPYMVVGSNGTSGVVTLVFSSFIIESYAY